MVIILISKVQLNIYAKLLLCRRGGIGRRAGLKIQFPLREYRFDPDRRYQKASSEVNGTLKTSYQFDMMSFLLKTRIQLGTFNQRMKNKKPIQMTEPVH